MLDRLEDIIAYLSRERGKFAHRSNGEMVKLLTGYIAVLLEIKERMEKEDA